MPSTAISFPPQREQKSKAKQKPKSSSHCFQVQKTKNLFNGKSFLQKPLEQLPASSALRAELQRCPGPTPGGEAVSEGGFDPGAFRRIGSEPIRLGAEDTEGAPRLLGEEEREEDRGGETRGRRGREEDESERDRGGDSERRQGAAEIERDADELAAQVGLCERRRFRG